MPCLFCRLSNTPRTDLAGLLLLFKRLESLGELLLSSDAFSPLLVFALATKLCNLRLLLRSDDRNLLLLRFLKMPLPAFFCLRLASTDDIVEEWNLTDFFSGDEGVSLLVFVDAIAAAAAAAAWILVGCGSRLSRLPFDLDCFDLFRILGGTGTGFCVGEGGDGDGGGGGTTNPNCFRCSSILRDM